MPRGNVSSNKFGYDRKPHSQIAIGAFTLCDGLAKAVKSRVLAFLVFYGMGSEMMFLAFVLAAGLVGALSEVTLGAAEAIAGVTYVIADSVAKATHAVGHTFSKIARAIVASAGASIGPSGGCLLQIALLEADVAITLVEGVLLITSLSVVVAVLISRRWWVVSVAWAVVKA